MVPEGLGVLESEDTMKYYYCDSWRVLIVDENNDAVTFSIGEGDYARGFCDGLEQVGFVKAGADLFDAYTKLLTSQRDKEDAYTMYVHANEKYCNALNEFNDVKSKYSIKD